jgi:hypothetical protein
MGLKKAFESLLRMGDPGRPRGEDPVSMVLLLKESHFPKLAQLREAAGRAFGASFSGDRSSRHSVYQRGVIFTLANVGPHTLSFLYQTMPYADNSERAREFEKTLLRVDQRQAWAEHSAYMAIDYVQGDVDIDSKYVVLARLCAQLYDTNCVALYLPRECALVPGDTAARQQMNKIIAYRSVDVT